MTTGGTDDLVEAIADRLPDADLVATHDEAATRAAVRDAAVLVTSHLPDDLLDLADRLEWVHAVSSGVDGFGVDRLEDDGVVLTNSSGVHAEPIGEQVLGYLLLFERQIVKGIAQQRHRTWERYGAREFRDRTVGLVGVGAVGTRVAEFCEAIGATVLGVKRDPSECPDAVDEVFGPPDLDDVLERADYLVLACPLTDETRELVDADALARLPEWAVLVNVARGEIVDEPALIEALQSGEIRGAALDVVAEEPLPEDSPLWGMENVVITPHVAGSTPHYWERCADIFAENYRQFVDGEPASMTNRIV